MGALTAALVGGDVYWIVVLSLTQGLRGCSPQPGPWCSSVLVWAERGRGPRRVSLSRRQVASVVTRCHECHETSRVTHDSVTNSVTRAVKVMNLSFF